jgi:hypothetical protein
MLKYQIKDTQGNYQGKPLVAKKKAKNKCNKLNEAYGCINYRYIEVVVNENNNIIKINDTVCI